MKKQKEEKKKNIATSRILSNCFFAVKIIASASKLYIGMALGCSTVFGIIDFLSSGYLLRKIVNSLERGEDPMSLVIYISVIGIISLICGLIADRIWFVEGVSMWEKISSKIDKMLFRKATKVELSCYENPEFYDRYVRAMEEAHMRMMKVLWSINGLVARFIALSANSLLLFTIDPVLIIFGLIPFVFGITKKYEREIWHNQEVADKTIKRKNEYVQRTFYLEEYAKEMKLGSMWRNMLRDFRGSYEEFRALVKNYGVKSAVLGYIQEIGKNVIGILGATLYAVWSCVCVGPENGGMTVGDCIVVLSSVSVISYALNGLVANVAEFGEHALFLEDVRYFLDYEPKIQDGEKEAPDGGDLKVENLSYKYEGSDKYVLKNVSFTLKKGERIALVGANGSGKTTLVKLLLRLYDPTEGNISMGGENIKNFTLDSYRERFGAVFQDFKMLSLTVKENVICRLPKEGDDVLVESALEKSGVSEKIASLEKGIDTVLTREFDENGANLSVGESQKVALAGIFANETPFVILDEPTSALDPIAEYKMFENMMEATEGKSVIFISHRLSSAVLADRVLLIDKGELLETGSHGELMKKDGVYAAMFRRQAENYLGEEAVSCG